MATDATNKIRFVNVRLSFPDLWKAKAVQKDQEPKFGAHFLLEKKEHEEQINALKVAIATLAKEKFGDDAVELIKKKKIHVCLHEGSDKDYDGYNKGNMFVSSSSNKRPLVVDQDRTPLAEEDRRPYGGCYVNAIIRLWPQDNEWGKRINAELMGVQYFREGVPFGAGPISEDEFDDVSDKKEKGNGVKKGEAAEPDDDEIPW